jgi:site-specific DNA recombinase
MLRAAVYARVSTARQAESDLSLPDQIAQCQSYCERRGWEVAEVFCEPGASALDEDRPGFQEMIYKATRQDHPFDYIVVHSLSRFSRDALHSEMYVRKLRKANVQLVSITQQLGSDSQGDLVRKVLNVFDEHQSRENAKHVHRAMVENAKQGFWNGSRPPFGYSLEVAERRGTKDKKILVIQETEARIIRLMFDLASGENGRPLGVKAIAMHLNERGHQRRGKAFNTGGVHALLTSKTYCGHYYFNRNDSRAGKRRPPSQWVEVEVPSIIDEQTFNRVQALLKSRSPKRIPPRVVNSPTLLAGVARCAYCESALIQNTGKGGAYRYYCCSKKLKEGALSCSGIRIPMKKLDTMVMSELAKHVLKPDRLNILLRDYVAVASERAESSRKNLTRMRTSLREVEASLNRLLQMVEKGLIDLEDPTLAERLVGLRLQRDELTNDIAAARQRAANNQPVITPEKVDQFALLLRENLFNGTPELRQAYARLLLSEVLVSKEDIRMSGSKTALANAAEKGAPTSTSAVLSFVREWRTGEDSNP